MSKYIGLYTNNPAAGGTDGTGVSEVGSQTSPVSVTLDASKGEVKYVKAALRCAEGYATVGNTVISFEGKSADKWKVAMDNGYTQETVKSAVFADSITLTDSIGSTNTIIWFRIMASEDEEPGNDDTVTIKAVTTIKAAGSDAE